MGACPTRQGEYGPVTAEQPAGLDRHRQIEKHLVVWITTTKQMPGAGRIIDKKPRVLLETVGYQVQIGLPFRGYAALKHVYQLPVHS